MLIAFPVMHEALAVGLPREALLFDPGLADAAKARAFRPADLPLGPREARRAMAEMLRLGEQYKNVRDLAALRSQNDFYSDTGMAIRSELEDRLGGKADLDRAKALSTAQTELLLAYTFEEHQLELAEIEKGVAAAGTRFQESLGLEDDAADLAELGLAAETDAHPALAQTSPWRPVLAAMLAFVPEDALLVTDQGRVAEDLAEAGLTFAPTSPEQHASLGLQADATALVVEAPGYRLCGLGRADPARPWLDATRRLACLGTRSA